MIMPPENQGVFQLLKEVTSDCQEQIHRQQKSMALTKRGDKHLHTVASFNNLIKLYEAWDKPEVTDQWRAKLLDISGEIEEF